MTNSAKNKAAVWTVIDKAGMLLVLGLLIILCSLFVPNFFSVINFKSVGLAVITIGIISCTMLLCLASGDFDLSIGSIVGFAGVICAVIMAKTESVALGVGVALALGAMVGFVNGFVVAKLGINALITTLATMQIVRGLAFITTEGNTVGSGQEAFSPWGPTRGLAFLYQCGSWLSVLFSLAFSLAVPHLEETHSPSVAILRRRAWPAFLSFAQRSLFLRCRA